ncbi:MAG: hypothetical protein RLZZ77_875 [Bacteroidota bacterium]
MLTCSQLVTWAQSPQVDDQLVNTVIVFSLLPFLVAFAFLFFIFYRQKRESDLRRLIAETEMKALRAQMNPHFLFNSLNSIYLFIQNQQTEQASDFLLKFSKLIRTVLEYSRKTTISVEEDIEWLKLYMDLEGIRQPFRYTIEIDPSIDTTDLMVPPMILQPFIENSILHGFREKQGDAVITIKVQVNEHEICYITEDNGTLPTPSNDDVLNVKKKSLGTVITRERLQILNSLQQVRARFKSDDIIDEMGQYLGKRTIIYLPKQSDSW